MDRKQMLAYMKQKNNLQIKNMKKFQSAFMNQTQLNTMENNDLDTTQIRLLQPEKDHASYDKWKEDFMALIQQFIPNNDQAEDIYDRVYNADINANMHVEYIKEFDLNFELYKPIFKRYEGHFINKSMLIEQLIGAIKPNVIKKYPGEYYGQTMINNDADLTHEEEIIDDELQRATAKDYKYSKRAGFDDNLRNFIVCKIFEIGNSQAELNQKQFIMGETVGRTITKAGLSQRIQLMPIDRKIEIYRRITRPTTLINTTDADDSDDEHTIATRPPGPPGPPTPTKRTGDTPTKLKDWSSKDTADVAEQILSDDDNDKIDFDSLPNRDKLIYNIKYFAGIYKEKSDIEGVWKPIMEEVTRKSYKTKNRKFIFGPRDILLDDCSENQLLEILEKISLYHNQQTRAPIVDDEESIPDKDTFNLPPLVFEPDQPTPTYYYINDAENRQRFYNFINLFTTEFLKEDKDAEAIMEKIGSMIPNYPVDKKSGLLFLLDSDMVDVLIRNEYLTDELMGKIIRYLKGLDSSIQSRLRIDELRTPSMLTLTKGRQRTPPPPPPEPSPIQTRAPSPIPTRAPSPKKQQTPIDPNLEKEFYEKLDDKLPEGFLNEKEKEIRNDFIKQSIEIKDNGTDQEMNQLIRQIKLLIVLKYDPELQDLMREYRDVLNDKYPTRFTYATKKAKEIRNDKIHDYFNKRVEANKNLRGKDEIRQIIQEIKDGNLPPELRDVSPEEERELIKDDMDDLINELINKVVDVKEEEEKQKEIEKNKKKPYNKLTYMRIDELNGNLAQLKGLFKRKMDEFIEHHEIFKDNQDYHNMVQEIQDIITDAETTNPSTQERIEKLNKIRAKLEELHKLGVDALKQHYGHGIQQRKMMRPQDHALGQNYMIDTDKLRKSILEIRYIKNRHLTNIKSQLVTAGVKQILDEFIQHRTFNDREYNKLTNVDKHLIRSIFHTIKHQHLITDKEDDFSRQFEILRDEFLSGNNSEIIKRQLRQYIHHAINTKLLSRAEGLTYLNELEHRQ
jgi:hypothetical protein